MHTHSKHKSPFSPITTSPHTNLVVVGGEKKTSKKSPNRKIYVLHLNIFSTAPALRRFQRVCVSWMCNAKIISSSRPSFSRTKLKKKRRNNVERLNFYWMCTRKIEEKWIPGSKLKRRQDNKNIKSSKRSPGWVMNMTSLRFLLGENAEDKFFVRRDVTWY